jgi:hypothetical protein
MADKTTTLYHQNGVKVSVSSEKAEGLQAGGLFSTKSPSTSTATSKASTSK